MDWVWHRAPYQGPEVYRGSDDEGMLWPETCREAAEGAWYENQGIAGCDLFGIAPMYIETIILHLYI